MPSGFPIQFHGASLQQVLDLYEVVKERTVLQHPSLPQVLFTLDATPKNASEAAEVLEDAFRQNGLAVIPDGKNFVMVVPIAFTNTVIPKSSEIPAASAGNEPQPGGEVTPRGQVDFGGAALAQVLDVYGDWIGRKLVKGDTQLVGLPISLRTFRPLTKSESIYAVATLIEWSGYKIVFVGDKEFKVVPLNSTSEIKDK